MLDLSCHYVSGEEIHARDRASLAGLPGRVVFVLGFHEFLPEFVSGKEWYYEEYGHGFMFKQDGGGLVFQQESDEDFEFISRGESHVA
jgi:hypothetical protein